MATLAVPIFVDDAYAIATTTSSANVAISGATGQSSDAYFVMNNNPQEAWVVITSTPNPTAVFPTPATPQPGFAIPPNSDRLVRGVPCGNGKIAYAAAIVASGTGEVYISPCQT